MQENTLTCCVALGRQWEYNFVNTEWNAHDVLKVKFSRWLFIYIESVVNIGHASCYQNACVMVRVCVLAIRLAKSQAIAFFIEFYVQSTSPCHCNSISFHTCQHHSSDWIARFRWSQVQVKLMMQIIQFQRNAANEFELEILKMHWNSHCN